MVQTVLFVQFNSNILFHMPVIRFSSLRWDKAVQELMCGQAPLPCAQQLAHCTITQPRFPSHTVQTVAWFSSAILYGVTRTCVVLNGDRILFCSIFRAHCHMDGSFIHYSTALLLTAGLKHALQMYQIFMHSHIALNPTLNGNSVLWHIKLNWWCAWNTRQNNIPVLSGTATCRIKYKLPHLNTIILLVPYCYCCWFKPHEVMS